MSLQLVNRQLVNGTGLVGFVVGQLGAIDQSWLNEICEKTQFRFQMPVNL